MQHRNLFFEYHQIGSQKQTIFREPQMALSSTNFNNQQADVARQGMATEVYGDWKQQRKEDEPVAATLATKRGKSHKELNVEFPSRLVNLNRSFSPTQCL